MAYEVDYMHGSGDGRGYSSGYWSGRSSRYENEPYGRGAHDGEPYERSAYSGEYGEPHNRGRGGPYNLSYRSQEYNPSAPYSSLNYTRYGPSRYNDPYYSGRYGRGAEGERGFFERAGDEVRSWFGDEEAERRRWQDEQRAGQHRGRGPRGYQRSAERIREDVNDRLTDDPYLDATDIEVSVDQGLVTLTGTVYERNDKRRAEYLAESVSGVSDVLNQLRVNQANQTQTTYSQRTTGTQTSKRKLNER